MAVGDTFELEGLWYSIVSETASFDGSVKIVSVSDAENITTLTIPS